MVEIELDGKKVDILEGSMIMHAAEKAGTYIPHFCYHKKLSIAANCRMCLVDVEKAPKPMPACATPVTPGMIVRTKSDKAIRAQKSVMEFLLINHPLDCPICDQGGECQLQDLAVGYGGSTSRYEEEKRVVFHKDVGPLISMEEMSRCIHCTRCVRFGQEVAGVMELGMIHRGEHSEITSHNLREVADACVALIKNDKLSDRELLAIIPGQDYPGGGQNISPASDIADADRTGRGSLKVRARGKIEELARGQRQQVVTGSPQGARAQRGLEEREELTHTKHGRA